MKYLNNLIKRYYIGDIIPLSMTVFSVYVIYTYFSLSLSNILGLILVITGLSFWWLGKITIGKNWDVCYGKPKVKELVTHGIYSKFRHPIYYGAILVFIGLTILYKETIFTILSLTVTLVLLKRIHLENRYLIKKLGKRYLRYKDKTWF